MVDYRVTFKGDLGNLAQFDAAIRNSVTQSARAIEQSNKSLLSSVGNVQGLFNPSTSGAGLFYKNLRTEIDSTNKTFIQSGQVVRRTIADYELAFNKAKGTYSLKPLTQDLYESPYKKAIGDLDAYNAALKKIAPTEQRILADREATLKRTIPLEERLIKLGGQATAISDARDKKILQNQIFTSGTQGNIANLKTQRAELLASPEGADAEAIANIDAKIKELTSDLRAQKAAGRDSLKQYNEALQAVGEQIDKTQAKIDRLNASQQERASTLRSYNSGYGDLPAAANAVPPIQRDLATVLNQSKELRTNLLKAGLGAGTQYGSQEFQKALADQEASITRYTKNLRTNVSTVQGSFKDLNTGLLQQFTVDLDKNGQVVGRWGGQLAGAGTFLRQTVRDFQKVIEWTVATTLVFGTLAAVVKQLSSINELNTALARLSITAQTSAADTEGLFEKIGQVAIQTATPLKELVTAADDIALAVRTAGDTTDEFQAKIIDLTRAVGIFTNLTGTDTVQATDQLSAAFKQLGIEPAALIGILNKVTAVAGGQSTAINDIVKSLAGLSEAAKAAGLSVDEQIASIQVLSQVTNKSSDEVATSFKNLFGAVSSVGSEKILKEFGINIRDSQGGLRDFLDIYKDVKDALDKGIIPENRLPDVLRGISGGPRRAPDAAALLSNLDKVFQVVGKSAGATNEALIANAKILDTNAAKITQFQNAIDIAIFQKFGSVIKDLVTSLTDIGTVGANLFAGIPTDVISLTVKLTALVLIIKTLGSVAKLTGISGALGELSKGFRAVGTEAEIAAAKAAQFSAVPRGITGGSLGVSSLLSKFTGNKGLIAGLGIAAAGVAGGVAAQGTGIDTNTIGTITQLAGTLALASGAAAPLGIGLLAAGTALQLFAGDSTDASKSTADLTKDILTLTDSLQASQTDANNFSVAQKKAGDEIKLVSDKVKKTADDQTLLASATDDYVTATLGLATANQAVSKTFDELISKLQSLSPAYKEFIGLTREQLNAPEVQKLRNQLVEDLLKATGQQVFTGTPLQASKTFTTVAGTNTVASTNPDLYRQGVAANQIDLADLIKNPGGLKDIFDLNNGAGTSLNIPQNQVALGFLQGALAEISTDLQKYGVSQEQYDNLTKSISALAGNVGTSGQNTAIVAQTGAAVQANQLLGVFRGAQADNAALDVKLLDLINKTQQNAPRTDIKTTQLPGGRFSEGIDTKAQDALQGLQKSFADIQEAALKGLQPTNQQLIDVATNTFKAQQTADGLSNVYDDLKSKGDDALNKGILNYLTSIGVSTDQITSLTKQYGLELKDVAAIADEVAQAFEDARKSAAQSYGERALQLQISANSGDFDKNAAGLKTLTEQNKQALKTNNDLISSMENLSQTGLADLNNSLSGIIGLQGEYLTQNDLDSLAVGDLEKHVTALTSKMIENAVAAGVNADGIKKIEVEVAKLNALIALIDTYKKVIIDIQTRISTDTNIPTGLEKKLVGKETDTQTALTAAQKQQKALTDIINQIYSTGKGSSLGKLPSSKTSSSSSAGASGPDVSTIDLPDEIANAVNRNALIQEAIKKARALQNTLPGENKEASNDIVGLLKGAINILNVRGVKSDYLTKALEELAAIEKQRLDFETKADTIRRIRIGGGSFSALANVPVNSTTGISLGSPSGPVNISLNVNGAVQTPAQLQQLADLIASSLKRQIANG